MREPIKYRTACPEGPGALGNILGKLTAPQVAAPEWLSSGADSALEVHIHDG